MCYLNSQWFRHETGMDVFIWVSQCGNENLCPVQVQDQMHPW